MLPGVLAMIDARTHRGRAAEGAEATYLPKRLPDRRIDWMQNARRIYDLVRALTDPYGGAFGWLGNRRMIVWDAGFSHEPIVARPGEVVKMTDRGVEVATGAGLVVLRRVQVGEAIEPAVDVFERERIRVGAVLAVVHLPRLDFRPKAGDTYLRKAGTGRNQRIRERKGSHACDCGMGGRCGRGFGVWRRRVGG